MFPWEEYGSGLAIRDYMQRNPDYCVYLTFLYIGLAHYGPAAAKYILGDNPPPTITAKGKRVPAADPMWLRVCMFTWNLGLSLFSIFGAMVIVPAHLRAFRKYGLYDAVCSDHPELLFTTDVGFWTALFSLSKIPELVDTLWLVLQKKKRPMFLHWFHHASVLVFSWFSYTLGNSTMGIFAMMNVSVHAVMYTYFAICALGFKRYVRPIAPLITFMQILQMVFGTTLALFSYIVNYKAYASGVTNRDELPCQVAKSGARLSAVLYLAYLYLFCKMFVDSYMRPQRAQTPSSNKEKDSIRKSA